MSERADHLHRTAKLLFESGEAGSLVEAEELLSRLVLQIDVGPSLDTRTSDAAALLTAINAGARAFRGGVHVRVADNPEMAAGWAGKARLGALVEQLGGELVTELDSTLPSIAINADATPGSVVMHASAEGWTGAVVQDRTARGDGNAMPLAGVLAGALAVSEAFQHRCGSIEAARRDVGISLWDPCTDWRTADRGPDIAYLPSALWLLGLGHLGQAYAWSLGMLPYRRAHGAEVFLVDTDSIIKGNLATGLLTGSTNVTERKTRVVARALEARGFKTAIVERLFDSHTHPTPEEPGLALAGFDSPIPRRALGGDRFQRAVDAGLGTGPVEYLDMLIHTFPSQLDPRREFDEAARAPRRIPARFEGEINDLVAAGATRAEAECGMAEIAGISTAAAFVGAVAGTLVVSDVLRGLHSGRELALIGLDLRAPSDLGALENAAPVTSNPGFVRV